MAAATIGTPAARRLALPLGFVALILLLAVFSPLLAAHDPAAQHVAQRLAAPSWAHPLGQDEFGRDVLSRLLLGARASLRVALVSAAIAGTIGVALGLIGGYFGGIAELLTIRLTDVVLSFPPILLALLVVTLLGPGVFTLTLVLSILYVPGFARVAYGEVLSARALEYVEAARAAGAGATRILLRTILPNVAGPLLVQFSLVVASAIVVESGLSFLGLGVVPPEPSWGLMIRGARGTMEHAPLLLLWPCIALVATILAVNRLCDALRDAFDPRAATAASPATVAAAPLATGTDAPPPPRADVVLRIEDLHAEFPTEAGVVRAVDGVDLELRAGETLALVGESGCGKSATGLAILGLLAPAGRIAGGAILFRGRDGAVRDLVALDEAAMRAVRGDEIAMVFQEPMTSLNPVYRIGAQIAEALQAHRAVDDAAAREAAIRLLDTVGIPDAAARVDDFPHQLSGGMRQRAVIAMALACGPRLLIADEPTTALDVTIQAQILDLLRRLRGAGRDGLALLFITHNFGVVAEMADRVAVMYAGRIVEHGALRAIFRRPRHPYTRALLASIPRPAVEDAPRAKLAAIPGGVPDPRAPPPGCAFAPRCALAEPACEAAMPPLVDVGDAQWSRCRRWSEL